MKQQLRFVGVVPSVPVQEPSDNVLSDALPQRARRSRIAAAVQELPDKQARYRGDAAVRGPLSAGCVVVPGCDRRSDE